MGASTVVGSTVKATYNFSAFSPNNIGNIGANGALSISSSLSNGTGASNVSNQLFFSEYTLAAGGTLNLNVNTMIGTAGQKDAGQNSYSMIKLKRLAVIIYGNRGCSFVSGVGISSGGTSYAAGNTLTVAGGTGTAATLHVDTVSGGVITGISILTQGSYITPPSTPNSPTGGAGSGASITLTFGTIAVGSEVYVDTDVLTIGALSTTAQLTSVLTPNSASIPLPSGTLANPGFLILNTGGAGYTVGSSSTNNTLLFTNSGSNPMTFDLVVEGATA